MMTKSESLGRYQTNAVAAAAVAEVFSIYYLSHHIPQQYSAGNIFRINHAPCVLTMGICICNTRTYVAQTDRINEKHTMGSRTSRRRNGLQHAPAPAPSPCAPPTFCHHSTAMPAPPLAPRPPPRRYTHGCRSCLRQKYTYKKINAHA